MKRRSGQRGSLIRASYHIDNLALKTGRIVPTCFDRGNIAGFGTGLLNSSERLNFTYLLWATFYTDDILSIDISISLSTAQIPPTNFARAATFHVH